MRSPTIRGCCRAVQEYLRELESGRRPDRRHWLDRYPDLAEALNQCLDGLELVHQAAPLASPLSGHAPRLRRMQTNLLSANPLGDFQIVREIGRGGMGIVYEAVQLSLGRRVALKVLPFAATFDAKHLQRFRQEAQAAAQLHHTNIVPVYAVGCERGIHFYAMQLIEGQSLDVVVRNCVSKPGMGPLEVTSADTSLSSRRRESAYSGSVASTGGWIPTSAAGPAAPPSNRRRFTGQRGAKHGFGPLFHLPHWQGAGVIPHDRQLHGPGRRSPGICTSAGHRSPRHQAGEPVDRLPRERMDHRLRAGSLP